MREAATAIIGLPTAALKNSRIIKLPLAVIVLSTDPAVLIVTDSTVA